MDGQLGHNAGFDALVDDRPEDGVFRIDRAIYTDQAVFDAEMERIFEGGWLFLCHESQVRKEGDYFATHMGRQPVYVIRGKDGALRCFMNACAHRGAVLTPYESGNARTLTCRFHGWTYDCQGACIGIKNEKGAYAEGFDKSQVGLTAIPRLETYRGFVFGSLADDVPPLEDHLAAAKGWIDMLADQSPQGLEVVPGTSAYLIWGNWKMQAENGVDGYHVSTIHRVYANTVKAREARSAHTGTAKTEAGRITGQVESGSYDLGNGHISIWAQRTSPEAAPLYEAKDRLLAEFPPPRVKWMIERGRNLLVFPNVLLMDNPSTQIRTMRPLGPDRAEITVRCIAPVGESAEARQARLRKFEDFYLSFGMATPDDLAALEDTYRGNLAHYARWNEFSRGLPDAVHGADAVAKEGGFEPVVSSPDWDHEVLYHGFYRQWRRMMTR